MSKLLHLRSGKIPTDEIVKDWYMRLRKMGSQLSTTRMALRLGIWLNGVKFLITQLKCFIRRRTSKNKEGNPYARPKEWLMAVLGFIAGIADNWLYICRIGTLKFKSPFQEKWVSRFSTMPTIGIYTIQIISEFLNCLEQARKENKPLSEIIWAKRFFFLMKFSEYPVSELSWKLNSSLTLITMISTDASLLHELQLVVSAAWASHRHEHNIANNLQPQALRSGFLSYLLNYYTDTLLNVFEAQLI